MGENQWKALPWKAIVIVVFLIIVAIVAWNLRPREGHPHFETLLFRYSDENGKRSIIHASIHPVESPATSRWLQFHLLKQQIFNGLKESFSTPIKIEIGPSKEAFTEHDISDVEEDDDHYIVTVKHSTA